MAISESALGLDFRAGLAPKSSDYRKIVAAADRRKASTDEKPPAFLKNDSGATKTLAAWQRAQEEAWNVERLRAAQLISDLLLRGGSEVVEELREAVAPELLKDVLVRAGADYSLLLLIGEGRDEFEEAVALRKAQMTEAEGWLSEFKEPIRFLAEKRWSVLKQQNEALKNFESKLHWSKADMLLFRGARTKFSQALDEFRGMYDQYILANKKNV